MNKNDIIKLLNKRGFTFQKEIDDETIRSYLFINESELDKYYENVIILEVSSKGIYSFYYRQTGMLGFMDSGELGMLENESQFNFNYKKFTNQVNCLRNSLL